MQLIFIKCVLSKHVRCCSVYEVTAEIRMDQVLALMELLWFWGEPDSKQGMEIHFYENKGKCYKNYDVTV